MKIQSTYYPSKPLTQDEWMKRYNVSSQVPKYDGQERAKEIMEQWHNPNQTESIWKKVINKLNVIN
jgi:hypothetical protein